jgi:hypothetical protein
VLGRNCRFLQGVGTDNERGVVTHFIGIQRLAPAKSLDDAPAEYQFRAAL